VKEILNQQSSKIHNKNIADPNKLKLTQEQIDKLIGADGAEGLDGIIDVGSPHSSELGRFKREGFGPPAPTAEAKPAETAISDDQRPTTPIKQENTQKNLNLNHINNNLNKRMVARAMTRGLLDLLGLKKHHYHQRISAWRMRPHLPTNKNKNKKKKKRERVLKQSNNVDARKINKIRQTKRWQQRGPRSNTSNSS